MFKHQLSFLQPFQCLFRYPGSDDKVEREVKCVLEQFLTSKGIRGFVRSLRVLWRGLDSADDLFWEPMESLTIERERIREYGSYYYGAAAAHVILK